MVIQQAGQVVALRYSTASAERFSKRYEAVPCRSFTKRRALCSVHSGAYSWWQALPLRAFIHQAGCCVNIRDSRRSCRDEGRGCSDFQVSSVRQPTKAGQTWPSSSSRSAGRRWCTCRCLRPRFCSVPQRFRPDAAQMHQAFAFPSAGTFWPIRPAFGFFSDRNLNAAACAGSAGRRGRGSSPLVEQRHLLRRALFRRPSCK